MLPGVSTLGIASYSPLIQLVQVRLENTKTPVNIPFKAINIYLQFAIILNIFWKDLSLSMQVMPLKSFLLDYLVKKYQLSFIFLMLFTYQIILILYCFSYV